MFENSAQMRKRELLIRIAKERLDMLETVSVAQEHASACSDALSMGNKVVRGVAGAAIGVFGVVAALLSSRKKSSSGEFALSPQVGATRFVVANVVTAVLIPWLRKTFVGAPPVEEKKSKGVFGFFKRLIFRK
jgi:hypothetical protein